MHFVTYTPDLTPEDDTMLNESGRVAANILAQMSPEHRKNAAQLGFVTLGLCQRGPSWIANTIDINADILEEEARIRVASRPNLQQTA
jgi:hypothetical protein